ncbi:protein anon-37Cs-like [Biomphalaria glabrata]|uniref:Protein anon-37Cs-like n=1 Tax=Biomphalaria glabrata TaxID=6526 RepID=A0A9U8DUT7_BIOGL|nr:protein anon-37Cs-like [Biomphalaria glabrata]
MLLNPSHTPTYEMADEKYPRHLSNVHITDIKQVLSILPPHVIHLSKSECSSETLKSDPAVVDFLTHLGANLFAHSNVSRSVSHKRQSFSNLATKSFSLNEDENPVSENSLVNTVERKPKEAIHVRSMNTNTVATSMPSHKILVKQDLFKLNNRDNSEQKEKLFQEKRCELTKEKERLRQKCMQRALNQTNMIKNVSVRVVKETQLNLDYSMRRSLWLSKDKMTYISDIPIIVVGAGLAGLSAAHQLLTFGFKNVIVLEASNRVGGRIHTLHVNDTDTIELGAPGLDLPVDNKEIFKKAAELGLADSCYQEPTPRLVIKFPSSDGRCDVSARSIRLFEQLHRDIKLLTTMSSNCIDLSYDSYFAERYRRITKSVKIIAQSEHSMVDYLKSLSDNGKYFIGDSVGNSAVQRLNEPIIKTHLKFSNGAVALIDMLTKHFPPHTIHYNSEVRHIDWSNIKKQADPRIRITCTNGDVYLASHVIVAIPVGYLKESAHLMFQPSLPTAKLNAIQKVGFGTVSKAFFLYDSPLSSINFIVADTFETAIHIQSNGTNILEITAVGSFLEEIAEPNLIQTVTEIMRNNYNPDWLQPVRVIRTSWTNNPLYRGSHPYFPTQWNQSQLYELSRPILSQSRVPLVQFAGDYTHESLQCLVEAAYYSGVREARRLHNVYDRYYGYENTRV